MAEYNVIMDPSSAHPSSSLTVRYVESAVNTNTASSGLRVGFTDSSTGGRFFGILYGKLPLKEDIFGAGGYRFCNGNNWFKICI